MPTRKSEGVKNRTSTNRSTGKQRDESPTTHVDRMARFSDGGRDGNGGVRLCGSTGIGVVQRALEHVAAGRLHHRILCLLGHHHGRQRIDDASVAFTVRGEPLPSSMRRASIGLRQILDLMFA